MNHQRYHKLQAEQKLKLKKTRMFYSYLFVILFCLGAFFFYQQARTKRAISSFIKSYQLSQNEIKYKSISHPIFGNGLIFYNVSFPKLSIDHSIEKMIVEQQSDFLHIRFINTHIDVLNTLRKAYNINIIQTLKNYIPMEDSFQKPIQTLALSNIDNVTLDISLIIKNKNGNLITYGQILSPNLIDIDFKARINSKQLKKRGLFYSFYTSATPLSVTFKNMGLFEKYDTYLASIGFDTNHPHRNRLRKTILRFLNNDLDDLDLRPAYKNK